MPRAGLLASIFTESNLLASIFVAIACFGIQIQVPAWWASATQVSGRHLGALFGMMNMLGAVGGISSQIFLGRFADWMQGLGYTGRAQWDPGFYVYVGDRPDRHDSLELDRSGEDGGAAEVKPALRPDPSRCRDVRQEYRTPQRAGCV